MTGIEFKGWLEGFSEGIKGAPTAEQWETVKQKMKMVYEPHPMPYNPIWPAATPVSSSLPPQTPRYLTNICTTGGVGPL